MLEPYTIVIGLSPIHCVLISFTCAIIGFFVGYRVGFEASRINKEDERQQQEEGGVYERS